MSVNTRRAGDLPRKRQDLHNWAMDSTRWDDFPYRDGDIVIATWAKSGTSWIQQIVAQLLFDETQTVSIETSAWIEYRPTPKQKLLERLEAQTHRRFVKTHLPVDAIEFSDKARYVHVSRDGRDAIFSWYDHHLRLSAMVYESESVSSGKLGRPLLRPTTDPREYFNEWLDRDDFPWPFWSNIQSWWDVRDMENVLLLHFNALKSDLPGEIARIAEFLSIKVAPASWRRIIEHCTFDFMKTNAAQLWPSLEGALEGGARTYINRGTNGHWRSVLTREDIAKYERIAAERLTHDCAHWLATGERLS